MARVFNLSKKLIHLLNHFWGEKKMTEILDQVILLLTKLQYCHVIDNNTGVVRLVEGPYRGPLESNEKIYGKIRDKLIVKEGQYAIILNPYNAKISDVKHGDREVRVGPAIFSLYPGEELEHNKIRNEYVLIQDTGLRMKALHNFMDGNGKERKAGDLWNEVGPTHYIPHKYAIVEKGIKAISLGRDQGIYVKNIRSGSIRLEIGPKVVMLSAQEELHEKEYTERELNALDLYEDEFDATQAIPLRLLKSEAVMIMEGETQRVEFGPKVILLGPFERPYIMKISGSTPKRSGVLKIWNIRLGPIFSTDELGLRTKDNAVLKVRLRYKWRFRIDRENPGKIFAVEDFIGLMTETMAGLIREEAANYNFEDFHSKAAEIVKTAIFGEKEWYLFDENGFEVFGIDIKNIVPEDPEIAAQLNAAIKSNMDVYVQKIKQTAELEAERQLIEGKTGIEKSKAALIELEQENLKRQKLGKAKISAAAEIEKARGVAEALTIKSTAENEAESMKIAKIIEVLKEQGGEMYIKLQQVLSFMNVDKTVIVPTDSKLFVPMGGFDQTKFEILESEE